MKEDIVVKASVLIIALARLIRIGGQGVTATPNSADLIEKSAAELVKALRQT